MEEEKQMKAQAENADALRDKVILMEDKLKKNGKQKKCNHFNDDATKYNKTRRGN